jgi:hypothetical protein
VLEESIFSTSRKKGAWAQHKALGGYASILQAELSSVVPRPPSDLSYSVSVIFLTVKNALMMYLAKRDVESSYAQSCTTRQRAPKESHKSAHPPPHTHDRRCLTVLAVLVDCLQSAAVLWTPGAPHHPTSEHTPAGIQLSVRATGCVCGIARHGKPSRAAVLQQRG